MLSAIFRNFRYLLSAQGILKIVELVALLIAFACVHWTHYTSVHTFEFFQVATLGAFISILLFVILTVLGIPSKIPFVNWLKTEFVLDVLAFLFVSVGSIVAALKSYDIPALVFSSVCGILVSFLLVASTVLSFLDVRRLPSTDSGCS